MLNFKQFYFQPNQNFEPSKSTKDFWLYTKKNKRTFAGINLPGLFETTDYSTQIASFIIILLFEGWATFYGVAEGVLWEGVVAAIIIDIVLAILSHNWHNRICLKENELVVTADAIIKEAYNRQIKSDRMKSRFFYLLIIGSGFFKFFLFYDAYMEINTITIGVFVCYIGGAVLHIYYTGYLYYTSRFNYKIQNEYTSHVNSGGQILSFNSALVHVIDTDNVTIKLIETNAGRHKIIKNIEGLYELVTHGILLDEELAQLIGVQQGSIAQGVVARAGLNQQLQILNVAPLNK